MSLPANITTPDECDTLRDVLHQQAMDARDVIRWVQIGHRELKHYKGLEEMNRFLDKLFTMRIGTRLLIDHYTALHDGVRKHHDEEKDHHDHREDGATVSPCTAHGLVSNCTPGIIVRDVASSLSILCKSLYGVSPKVKLLGEVDFSFAHIPEHIAYIAQEILKNSLRSSIERVQGERRNSSSDGGDANFILLEDDDIPPVTVEFHKGEFDVIMKISDQGGGMRPELKKKAFLYGFTTVGDINENTHDSATRDDGRLGGLLRSMDSNHMRWNEMAGYGFGLPLSRLYAKYFGGDLHVQSLYGYGTDVYVNLNHLGNKREMDSLTGSIESIHDSDADYDSS
ncbi:hypothetical protein FOZ60_004641 [Perkinsus olseni]|uniref:Protein-serine/threonine kinase n=2 Tax=Perkinsus olseni TaxID=32597 RepID=A0A7J6NSV2_PEROL|nr:hypothetical protein FOZ60_004641 [Perkinsus olseni]